MAQSDKMVMDNYLKAEKILQTAIDKFGGKEKFNAPISFDWEGKKYFFGHYDTPEKTIAAADTEKIRLFPAFGIGYLYSSLDYYGNRTAIIMNHGDSTHAIGYFARDFSRGKLAERNQLNLSYPAQMLRFATKYKATWHFVGETATQNCVGFNDDIGSQFNLFLDKKVNRLERITQLTYNAIYGDGFDEVVYEYANTTTLEPSKFVRREHGLLESDFVYKDIKTDVKIDTGFVQYVCPTCTIEPIEKNTTPTIESIGKNLWLIALNHLNNKVLLAEYATYVMLFEAPEGTQTCREVIEVVRKKFPNKPIKYIALSHHHPDHAGGFAAFVEQNIQVITTKGNTAFFDKLLKTTHTLKPENTIKPSKMSAMYVNSKDSMRIKDADNQVVMYESGETTDHVQEFLFFYFPNQKILFVGDLIVFLQGRVADQRKRAYAVYKLIKDKNIDVEKIYTSWPLKGQQPYGTMEDLKAVLVKNYPDLGTH